MTDDKNINKIFDKRKIWGNSDLDNDNPVSKMQLQRKEHAKVWKEWDI